VGIGTTSPAYLLDVNGNAHFSSIYADGNIHLNQGQQIAFKIDNTYRNTITVNANELAIGYGTRPYRATRISGQSMHLYTYSGSAAAERLTILEGGNVGIGTTSPSYLLDVNGDARCTSIRVGDGLITWDSTNNALKVQKNDGSAANIYALGAVSALGFSAGANGTSIGTLTVNDQLTTAKETIGTSLTLNNGATMKYVDNNSASQTLIGFANSGARVDIGRVDSGGSDLVYMYAKRFYLTPSCYLYVSSAKLYFFNGTQSIQITT
jgi:hypothetical protein